MSDRAVVFLAVATWAGGWVAAPVPLWSAVGLVVLALVRKWPVLLIGATALLSSSLGARAWDGLEAQASALGPAQGEVTLLTDPVDAGGGSVRVEARWGRQHVEAWAHGASAAALRSRLAGERVELSGKLSKPPEWAKERLAVRHIAARLTVTKVSGWNSGHAVHHLANGLRRTLARGATPLGDDRRALLLGMVLGDDRAQSDEVTADFRAAGLTHLLAVSGQNVAFVLVLFGPLSSRLGLRSRWALTLTVIAFFALITRFEPSVLRASVMAALAATALGLGRPVGRSRLLALAVTVLIVLDPFLVRSVGFQLSVGAALGIIALAPPLASRFRGPRWLVEPLAVAVAAQVGVAPVLVAVFGGLPVASVPANLLAVPAAGPVMMWGLTAGMLAGGLGPPFDAIVHLPTSAFLGWVAGVARWAAGMSFAPLGARHLLVIVAVTLLAVWTARRLGFPAGIVGSAAAVIVLVWAALVPTTHDVAGAPVAFGADLWRSGGAVVVVMNGNPSAVSMLDGLRKAGVRRLDVLVSHRGGREVAGTIATLKSRLAIGVVLAPVGHSIRDALVPGHGAELRIADLSIVVRRNSPSLDVAIWPPGGL